MNELQKRLKDLTPEQRQLLALRVRRRLSHGGVPSQEPAGGTEGPVLSHAQRRFWWLHQLDPNGFSYNTHAVVEITGSLCVPALQESFTEIVRRHSVLRTTYANEEGVPRPVLHATPAFGWQVEDLSDVADSRRPALLERRIAEMVRAPFDLEQGPLLRVSVWRMDTSTHVVAIAKHHIVSDRWSMGLLVREVAALYDALATGSPSPLPELPRQYADFARAQASASRLEAAALDEAYWRNQLEGELVPLRLPADRSNHKGGPFVGASLSMEVPEGVVGRTLALAHSHNVTLFMALFAAFAALLHRYSHQRDIVIGVPASGRREEYTHSLIGCFINTLPLRCDVGGNPTFLQLLDTVRRTCLDAFSHQELPFERVVEILNPRRSGAESPLFRVMFTLNDVHDPLNGYGQLNSTLARTGLTLRTIELEQSNVPCDLILHLDRHADGLRARLAYDTSLFAPPSAGRILQEYCTLLAGVTANAALPLSQVPLLDGAARRRLLDSSRGPAGAYPACSISEAFESVVARMGDRVALVSDGHPDITYAELNERANRWAHTLIARGIRPGQVVGLLAERTPRTIAAAIGVLKVGAVYLPLDWSHPPARLARMLQMASAALLLCDTDTPDAPVPVARLDREDEEPATNGNVRGRATIDSLAYVCFTSGSTGTPKGVAVPHRGVMRLVFGRDCVTLGPEQRILHLAPFAFDASTFEIWGALLHGGSLVLFPERVPSAADLQRTISTHGVTTMWLTASLFNAIADEAPLAFQGLQQLLVGGEALSITHVRAVRRALPDLRLINGYGPTEATTFSCLYEIPREIPESWESVPIGRSLSSSSAYVVDPQLEPAPINVPGELYIGGDGLAIGYIGQPRATAERFVPDPSGPAGSRLYRTGDIVSLRSDGAIEFLARRDHQVKIRGFRVELGEIEHTLLQHPNIREAAVLYQKDGRPVPRLVAYVSPRALPAPQLPEIDRFLATTLPEYMLPDALVSLESLPRLASQKIDRGALAQLNVPELAPTETADVPEGEVEIALAELWRALLGIERPGRFDSFFSLGGHSILATQLAARIERRFAVAVPLRVLMEEPTIEAMARHVTARRHLPDAPDAMLPAIVPAPEARYEPFPLTDIQQAYWIGRTMELPLGGVSSHGYQEVDILDLDLPRLEQAFQNVIERHDMLRAVIDRDGRQRILPSVPPFRIQAVDLRTVSEAAREHALAATREQMSHEVTSADAWPLFAVRASRIDERRTRLHVSTDALIGDASSWRTLGRELTQLYRNPDASLEPLDITFRDYVLALQSLKASRRYVESEEYWRARIPTLPPAPPLGRPTRATAIPPRFSRRSGVLPADTWDRLKGAAGKAGVSPTAILLSAFSEVIATWSGADRFTISLTVFNRLPLHPHVGRIVGDFTALILLPVDRRRESFLAGAKRLQQHLWESLDHRYFTGVQVLRELTRIGASGEAASVPVVFTSLVSQELDAPSPLGEVVFGITQTPQVSLDHQVYEKEGNLAFNWDAVEDLFPDGCLDEMFASYTGLLQRLTAEDDAWRRVTDLVPDPDSERRRIFNSTEAPVAPATLHGLFIDQVPVRPEHLAVISPTRRLTYRDLDRESDWLAQRLRAAGARPNTLVAVAMERGWEQVVGVVGVLKAGAAYLPLDPGWPVERLRQVLDHAQVRLVVADPGTDAHWPDGVRILGVQPAEAVPSAGNDPCPQDTTPNDLAYVIYTSGSTGEPKGVMIDHRGAVNTILDINDRFAVGPTDRVLALSSLSFDLSVYDIFGTFAAGGTIVMPSRARPDPSEWAGLVSDHQVTVWNSVPALMELFVDYVDRAAGRGADVPASLRLIMLSGDWIPLSLVPRITSTWCGAKVVSLGGATEASIWSIAFPIDQVDDGWRSIPYGRPLRNQTIHVLTPWLGPCRVGVVGELFIGGVGVAKGYWRDEQRTAARFITHPDTGERLYRTGDLARHLPDMTIELLGRVDFQVKVRGHRIELGEIEAALMRHTAVRAAVVAATGSDAAGRRLVAHVVPAAPGEADAATLRTFLAERLPAYMVPSAFVIVERLPLTRNGKIDRAALRAPAASAPAPPDGPAAPGLVERVASLVGEVVTWAVVGRDTNLLELGANSVELIRIVNSLENEYGVRLKLEDIYANPTVPGLAAGIALRATEPSTTADKAAQALAALKRLSPEEFEKRLQSTGVVA